MIRSQNASKQRKQCSRAKVASEDPRKKVELVSKKKEKLEGSRQASTQMIIDDAGGHSFCMDMSPVGLGVNPVSFGQTVA